MAQRLTKPNLHLVIQDIAEILIDNRKIVNAEDDYYTDIVN